ncbi:ATP-binding protein [Coprobacter tertius]|uniref:histidine kinase n=1 Tax=Coprobacter tertius TaxID=2944915 RepID=A0ABT1MMI8_9BACT|nr:ATP-binding protein [Coprobacter tertius]MCP9612968.1 ATP-binding protein [Coprobacter tertius]
MKKFSFIRTKVAVGYLSLIALLLISFYFIYREISFLSATSRYETELNEKRKVINRTLTGLYRVEAIGQTLMTGNFKDYSLYRKSVNETMNQLDSLRTFTTDSLQIERIGNIVSLLKQKEKNVLALVSTIASDEEVKMYEEGFVKIMSQQDSLIKEQKKQLEVIRQQDSLLNRPKPKRFLKRLAEAFSSEKEVSPVQHIEINSSTDSLSAINLELKQRISDRQQEIQTFISDKSNRLKRANQRLDAQIELTIREFEQEEIAGILDKIDKQQIIKRQAIQTIGTIATISVLLAIIFIIIILRDITRSNRYRAALEEANLQAENLLQIREKLMLTITHDFKAPLGSIIGYADLLSRLIQENRQRFYLDNMRQSSQHLLRLVNELLDFHRLDSKKAEINSVVFSPDRLFEEIKNRFTPLAQKKGLELIYETDGDITKTFAGDTLRITQIAENLLSNAIKFTESGHVTLYVTITGRKLCFTITDTGCGISKNDKEKIFREFTRLQGARGQEGFGLGLSITLKLVELLKGTIDVDSEEGKGSRFSIEIPLLFANRTNDETSAEKEKTLPILTGKNLKALIIDDDKLQLDLFSAQLKQLGIDSTPCLQPDELFAFLKNEKYDILFTDMQMPGSDGFEILNLLRNSENVRANNIPVIAVTARSDIQEEELQKNGFSGILYKPVEIKALAAIIGRSIPDASNKHSIHKPQEKDSSQIHFDALTAYSGNDPQAAAEIIGSFIDENRMNRENIQQSVQEKDMPAIARTAHKMRPLFSLIGATECYTLLSWLEDNKEMPFNETVKEKTDVLLSEIDRVIENAILYKTKVLLKESSEK